MALTADGGASLNITGATVTQGVDPAAPVVLAQNVPGYTDPLCRTDLPAGSAVGMVVACERGVAARVTKGRHVQPSGAAGMILYNLVPANGTGLNTDNHFIPSVHIDVAGGEDFVEFMAYTHERPCHVDPGRRNCRSGRRHGRLLIAWPGR